MLVALAIVVALSVGASAAAIVYFRVAPALGIDALDGLFLAAAALLFVTAAAFVGATAVITFAGS